MPVNYMRYHPDWKDVIRPRILKRDGYKCKKCGLANRALVIPGPDGKMMESDELQRKWAKKHNVKVCRVILTIAHLNHLVIDNRDENLESLCQWCHLDLDRDHKRDMLQVRKTWDADEVINILSVDGGEKFLPHGFAVVRGLRNQLSQLQKIREKRPRSEYKSKFDNNIDNRIEVVRASFFRLLEKCTEILAVHYEHPDPLDFYQRYTESDRRVFDVDGVYLDGVKE